MSEEALPPDYVVVQLTLTVKRPGHQDLVVQTPPYTRDISKYYKMEQAANAGTIDLASAWGDRKLVEDVGRMGDDVVGSLCDKLQKSGGLLNVLPAAT
jgi:hypothetical protein